MGVEPESRSFKLYRLAVPELMEPFDSIEEANKAVLMYSKPGFNYIIINLLN